jgi:hypothetical protein
VSCSRALVFHRSQLCSRESAVPLGPQSLCRRRLKFSSGVLTPERVAKVVFFVKQSAPLDSRDRAECFSCYSDRQDLLGIFFLWVSMFGAGCSSLVPSLCSCFVTTASSSARPEQTLCAATVVSYSSFVFCFGFDFMDSCMNSSWSYS